MSETILTAENLKFRYDNEQPVYALDGVSTSVKRGEFVAVLGANGCGKSTLAKHFNAILLPESGTVLVEGMDTKDEDKIYDIRQKVGMVFQKPNPFPMSIYDNIAYGPRTHGIKSRVQLDEIVDLIVDTVCSARKVIRIAGDDYPAEVVKSRFMKLNSSHVQYVMDCMKDNTTYVRNIKKYLLAALYNAPTTINSYYSSLVQHDMYGDRQRGRG